MKKCSTQKQKASVSESILLDNRVALTLQCHERSTIEEKKQILLRKMRRKKGVNKLPLVVKKKHKAKATHRKRDDDDRVAVSNSYSKKHDVIYILCILILMTANMTVGQKNKKTFVES